MAIKLIRDKYNQNRYLIYRLLHEKMYETNESVSAELLSKYGVLSTKPGITRW